MYSKIALIWFIFLVSIRVFADSPAAVTYGDLMIEDQQADLAGRNQLQVSTGYDVTNPYLNTYSTTLVYTRELSPLFAAGVEGSAYKADSSRYNDRLNKELQVFGVDAANDVPKAAAFALGKLHLLQGRVNLLGLKALPFQFNLKAGGGYIWHDSGSRTGAATWGTAVEIFPTARWSVALRFDQDLESPFNGQRSTIYRNRLALGLGLVF